MSPIKSLDALCVANIILDDPVTFGFGGTDYTGTTGPRETFLSLEEGGVHNDQEFTILIPIAAYGSDTKPAEKDTLTVCVDDTGVPCSADESTGRVNARVERITRAGAAHTYTMRTISRG